MAIRELARWKVSNCEIVRRLGVDEKAVWNHLKRMAEGAEYGRSKQTRLDPADLASRRPASHRPRP